MPSLAVAACLLGIALLGSSAIVSAAVEPPIDIQPEPYGQALAASMIWGPDDPKATPAYTAFRKSFDLPAGVYASTMHLFADSRYVLWINGRYVERGPCRFEWRGPQYDTIDVRPHLVAGRNTIVVLVLGHGRNGKMMRHAPGLALHLQASTGGGPVVVRTDATWKWSDKTRFGPPKLTWPGIQDRIDATRDDGDWIQPAYDDAAWRPARSVDGALWGPLTASATPPMREVDVPLTPDAPLPRELKEGETATFAAGRLVQAYVEFELDAEAGTTLELPHAPALYVAKPGLQTFTTFDTSGFAAASVKVTKGKVTLRRARAVERIYPFDVIGSFKSSDPALDKLWAVSVRSLQVMSEDAYVDCADRERVEWMDCDPPAFGVTQVALAGPPVDGKPAFADARLLGAMVRRTALSIQPEGWVKAHTCSDRFDIHAKMEDRCCEWIAGIRRYHESTGDAALVRELWPAVRTQLDWFLSQRTARGLVHAREWVTWGNPAGYQTFEGAALNAFVYRALGDGAILARAIGRPDDAARFAQEADALAAAFNAVLWDEALGTYAAGYWGENASSPTKPERPLKLKLNDNLVEPTGYAALFALDRGIVPADRRDRVTAYLLANYNDAPTIMPYYYLFQQWYGRNDATLDARVLNVLREKWRPQIEWPGETTWEGFDVGPRGSKAHIYGLFPAQTLSQYVLGVRRERPMWEKKIVIDPRLGDLTSAEGKVGTEFGVVSVSWKRDADALNFTFDVPAGVTADLRLPGAGTLNDAAFNGRAEALKEGRYAGRITVSPAK